MTRPNLTTTKPKPTMTARPLSAVIAQDLETRRERYVRVAQRAGAAWSFSPESLVLLQEQRSVGVQSGVATVRLDSPIDPWFGVAVTSIVRDLSSASDLQRIDLVVNSPGGLYYDAVYLAAELRRYAESGVTVTSHAQGLVASAAVDAYVAGDTRTAATGSSFMLHSPWSAILLLGTADEIETQAAGGVDGLRVASRSGRSLLMARTGASGETVDSWLEGETWMTADEAVEAGIAGEVSESRAESLTETEQAAVQAIYSQYRGGQCNAVIR